MNEQDKEDFDVEAHKTRLEGDDLAEDVEGHKMKAGLIDDEDVEGHRVKAGNLIDDDEDVEGHRLKAGNLIDEDEDVEGHRMKGADVQPPRDTDLGGSDR
jgi:hypothetical protein